MTHDVSPLHFPKAGPLSTKVTTGRKQTERNTMGMVHLSDSYDDLENIHMLRWSGGAFC